MKKKIILTLSLCLLLILTLTACKTSISYTFQIDNGDKIKVSLETTDGYKLLQKDGVFTVQKDEKDVLIGYFLTSEGYEEKAAVVNDSDDATILTATPENSPTFYCYQFEGEAGTETDFLFKIDGSETGAIVGSLNSREEAEAAFQLLTIEKAE